MTGSNNWPEADGHALDTTLVNTAKDAEKTTLTPAAVSAENAWENASEAIAWCTAACDRALLSRT